MAAESGAAVSRPSWTAAPSAPALVLKSGPVTPSRGIAFDFTPNPLRAPVDVEAIVADEAEQRHVGDACEVRR